MRDEMKAHGILWIILFVSWMAALFGLQMQEVEYLVVAIGIGCA